MSLIRTLCVCVQIVYTHSSHACERCSNHAPMMCASSEEHKVCVRCDVMRRSSEGAEEEHQNSSCPGDDTFAIPPALEHASRAHYKITRDACATHTHHTLGESSPSSSCFHSIDQCAVAVIDARSPLQRFSPRIRRA